MDQGAFAKIEGREFEFYMTKRRVTIGRNSKQGSVDVNMGTSRFISRKHVEIMADGTRFFLLCSGKNGVFVDDIFQRRESKRLQMPSSCIIRFPSTQIKLFFTSLIVDDGSNSFAARPSSPLPPLSRNQSPFVSPMPSPTGTISVIHSLPTSPGSSDHRYKLPSFDVMARYASKLLASHGDNSNQSDEEHNEGDDSQQNGGDIKDEEERDEVSPLPRVDDSVAGPSGSASGSRVGDMDGEEGMPITLEHDDHQQQVKKQAKPPYSYAQLIVQALLASKERKQTLSSIYAFISDRYPHYKLDEKGWKNSIRHNLSLNQYFMKAPREREGLGFGKGGYWCMHPDYEDKLTSQAYVKRKKKGIPVFPSAGLISRSAPPSPTHHPFLPAELNLVPQQPPAPPPPTHFTLPSYVPRLPPNASHSLPASPSRLPHTNFSPAHLRFFPLNVCSTATDALALESRVLRPPLPDPGEKSPMPETKRPRLSEDSSEADEEARPVTIQNPAMMQLPPAAMFALSQPTNQMRFPFLPGLPAVLTQGSVPMVPAGFQTRPYQQLQVDRPSEGCSQSGGNGGPRDSEREH